MSRDVRQTILKLVLLASGVAVVVALAWWSLVGMVFVVLVCLLFGVVGWMFGYRAGAMEREQCQPTTRRRTPVRPRGRGRR